MNKLISTKMILICISLMLSYTFAVSEFHTDWRIMNASQYCPSQSVCGVSPVNVTEVMCCKDCQCDEKCKERGDCCFKGGVNIRCVNTNFYGKSESYYMETARLDTSSNDTLTVACKDDQRPTWLQKFPVYSKTSKQIYINSVCAEAHGVYDYEEATVMLRCRPRQKNTETALMTAAITALRNNQLQEGCMMQFRMPLSLDFIANSACNLNDVTYCSYRYLATEGENAIVQGCLSDFHAPVVATQGPELVATFKNVYCAACNYYTVMTSGACSDGSSHDGGGFSNLAPMFSLLIDNRELGIYKRTNVPQSLSKRPQQYVCLKQDGHMNMYTHCRPLLCPWGRIQDDNGECVWASKFITMDRIMVTLKLIPTSELHQVDFNAIDLYNVSSPWPQNWEIYNIEYYLHHTDSTLVDRVYVGLRIKQVEYNIEKVLSTVDLYSTMPWTIQLKGSEVILASALSETASPHDDPVVHTVWKAAATKDNVTMTFSIVHFCHHIQLTATDFSYQRDNNTIMSLLTDRTYHEGEFIFASLLGTAGLPRICVNGSGFVEIPSAAVSTLLVSNACLIVVLIFNWL